MFVTVQYIEYVSYIVIQYYMGQGSATYASLRYTYIVSVGNRKPWVNLILIFKEIYILTE